MRLTAVRTYGFLAIGGLLLALALSSGCASTRENGGPEVGYGVAAASAESCDREDDSALVQSDVPTLRPSWRYRLGQPGE